MNKQLSTILALLALFHIGWQELANAQMTKLAIGYSGISADQL